MDKKSEVKKLLLESKTYHEFFQQYVLLQKKWLSESKLQNSVKFSFSALSKRGGFASRNFAREVYNGTRRITPKSLEGFVKAFNLEDEFAEYFRHLVLMEEAESDPLKKQHKNMLRLLKPRLNNDNSKKLKTSNLFSYYLWPFVYAALGKENEGATLEEISNRTGIPEKNSLTCLLQMEKDGVIEKLKASNKDLYLPKNPHIVFKNLSNDIDYRDFVSELLFKSAKIARTSFKKEDTFFFTSAVSISQKEFPNFKKAFKEFLLSWVDKAENPLGDSVVNFSVAILPSKVIFSEEDFTKT